MQSYQPNYRQDYGMRQGDENGRPQYGNPYANRFSELGRDGGDQKYQPELKYDILARMVESENDILPKEIPMDGSFRLFVTNDMSKIYAKTWGATGLPQTIEYEVTKKEQQLQATSQPQVGDSQILLAIFERLVNMENRLSGILSAPGEMKMSKQDYQNKQRKQNNNQQTDQGGQANG